ncbi:hypothetical protein COCOR_02800 [Corallococcus coralloides DSM 2259]|uniref:DUF885 domain-containing protein n=1 Tax=Corallococcus coralloides (strain ATCC 25202 / DSM 2259 / NBRC 100086 / M2) TaxID=1144275 RepID=H8MX08_CORCM|nr:DUF885 domain-containing protein [Corallococcus coralloides]AFE04829.1 hypothetical protein COCOR_02800 [Corallococcus coralloides DSM 2259]
MSSESVPQRGAASASLHALLEAEWQYSLQQYPTYASLLGDRRWNDRWDDLSLAALDADHQHSHAVLRRLQDVDRAALDSDADRLHLDLFRRMHETWIEEYGVKWHLLPLNQMGGLPEGLKQPPGLQTAYQLADTLRFETVRDYEDWVKRLEGFGAYADQVVALMREGMRQHRIHPRIVLQRIPPQLERQVVKDPTQSGFYGPFTRMPKDFSAEDARRLSQAGRDAITNTVVPALKRALDFVTSEYLPAAPETVGVWQFPDGEALYTVLARRHTTTRMTPEEIHAMGLAEVQRLRAEMDAVMARTGYTGTLQGFFEKLRTETRFYEPTGESLLARYRTLARRIDPLLPRLFRTMPKKPYVVEPIAEAMAPDVTTGFYFPAAADGSRPGTFQVNLYRPETRPVWEMVPLTLHEAVPGHHFQVSLASEQTDVPDFRRFTSYVAFDEGWALYSESLGDELGLYDDPHDKFGQLAYEMWRAVRLVVDTGLHAKRWTRKQALDFFMENAPRQELDVTNEVDRYIAWPGQALAYKVGQLRIRALRDRAEAALGARFDVKAFHDEVLLTGSLPLDVLEAKVDAWVARESA